MQQHLITAVDQDYGVFDDRTFKLAKFESYLTKNGIAWARASIRARLRSIVGLLGRWSLASP